MIKLFENQKFIHLIDRGSAEVYEGMEFRKCYFEGCGLSITRTPERRTIIKNVHVVDCEARGCVVDGAVFDEMLIDGLRTPNLQTWAAVFKHTTIQGRIGKIMMSSVVASGRGTPNEQRTFDTANAAFYASVDWALDISDAEFEQCSFRGIPAKLIRRDAATQVVVTREKAIIGTWRDLNLSKTYWSVSIEMMLQQGHQDVVLVAPKRGKNFSALLDGLKMLRDAGVAEPT